MRLTENATQYYYQGEKISSIMRNGSSQTVFRHASHPLATLPTTLVANLLATDGNETVLSGTSDEQALAYTPYGDGREADPDVQPLGYNGEMRSDAECYFLGNGYRPYNPALMRFHLPDSESPFDRGGLNAYAYCLGDPVNFIDPSGHMAERPPARLPLNAVSLPPRQRYQAPPAEGGPGQISFQQMKELGKSRYVPKNSRDTSKVSPTLKKLDSRKARTDRRNNRLANVSQTQRPSSNIHVPPTRALESPNPVIIIPSSRSAAGNPQLNYSQQPTPRGRSYYRSTGAFSGNARFGLALVAIGAVGGAVIFGLYKLVQALRDDLN